jgi:hypothetical protein
MMMIGDNVDDGDGDGDDNHCDGDGNDGNDDDDGNDGDGPESNLTHLGVLCMILAH